MLIVPIARAHHHAMVAKLDRPRVAVGRQMADVQNGPAGLHSTLSIRRYSPRRFGRITCALNISLISRAFHEKSVFTFSRAALSGLVDMLSASAPARQERLAPSTFQPNRPCTNHFACLVSRPHRPSR